MENTDKNVCCGPSLLSEKDIAAIAEKTAKIVLETMFNRSRDEMCTEDICNEFGISKETIRRRVKAGLLQKPTWKRGRKIFRRSDILKADLRGTL